MVERMGLRNIKMRFYTPTSYQLSDLEQLIEVTSLTFNILIFQ